MAAAAESFPYFPHLPKELRLAIWRECLPNRVFEMDVPSAAVRDESLWCGDLHETVGCDLVDTTSKNSNTPVIARVCYEARMVAFETGRFTDVRYLWATHPNANSRRSTPWFDPARDAVHLHWDTGFEHYTTISRCNPTPALLSLGSTAAHGASLMTSWIDSTHGHTQDLLEQAGKLFMLCLEMVSIHSDAEPAIRSGLFGRLGEERVVMVDADNHARMHLFDEFNRMHGSREDRQTSYFFQKWRSSGTDDVKWTMLKLERGWVGRRSWGVIPQWGIDYDALWSRTPVSVADGAPVHTRLVGCRLPNRDHEWVQSVLKAMPTFNPVYMIRLCTSKCT